MHTLSADRRGNIAVVFALVLFALAGSVGLAVDFTRAYWLDSSLTAAADAAALAGIAAPAADRVATARNAFDANVEAAIEPTVTVNGNFLTVRVSHRMETSLLKLVGFPSIQVGAESVAEAVDDFPPLCVLLLNDKSKSLLTNSSGTLDTDCLVQVNSSKSDAIFVNAGGGVKAAEVRVTGAVNKVNGGFVQPDALQRPAIPDPLAGLAEPTVPATCTKSGFNVNSNETQTLSEGRYCNGININSKGTLNLNPGIYYFTNGTINVNSGAKINGSGVMLYFADAKSTLNANSDADVNLTAFTGSADPTIDQYKGILLFQNRSIDISKTTPTFTINSRTSGRYEGTLYLSRSNITVNSQTTQANGNKLAAFTTVIAQSMLLNAGSPFYVRSNYSGLTPRPALLGGGARGARLVN